MSANTFSFLITSIEKDNLINNKEIKFLKSTNPYVEYFLVYKNCKITIFKTQKCLVQGQESDVLTVMQEHFPNHLSKSNSSLPFDYDKQNFHQNIIGSDEVGVGDYFGGLCVCAVFLTPETAKQAKTLGVKDSKLLNEQQIISIAKKLIDLVPYRISNLWPNQYNELMYSYKNAHVIKTVCHHYVIVKLCDDLQQKNLSVNQVVIDQFASEKKFHEYLSTAYTHNKISYPITFCTHAETKYLAVACASIIARYYFLEQIKTLSSQAGQPLPLGAWNDKIKLAATTLIQTCGNDSNKINELLNNYVKMHFSNTKKLIDEEHNN